MEYNERKIMSANQIKVRPKQVVKTNWNKYYLLFAAVVIVLLGAVGLFTLTNFSSVFGFSSGNFEVISENGRNRFRVPASGNLQGAIDRAKGGDIIELEAGAIYYEVTLPKKNITDFITIVSSAADKLPENKLVAPNQSKLMATIITRGGGKSAVATADGAHHYRFVGVEFAPSNKDYIYNLVYLGTDTDKVENVPHDFEFDRCYFHSIKEGVTRRGLGLNAQNVVVKNSYFQGFAFPQEETQGICGWSGTKNVKIINNYIEGGAENIMFGGSPPATPDQVPANIEIRNNWFKKQNDWRGKYAVKTLLELKEAKNVQIVGNFFENNLEGSVFRLTLRNDDGKSPKAAIEDVLIQNNIFKGSGEGINILGKDDAFPSQTMKRVKIHNNLFLDINSERYAGGGYFIQISDSEDVEVSNNTVFQDGTMIIAHGNAPKNFVFRDNILGFGSYGLHQELTNVKTDTQTFFTSIVRNNVVVNNKNVPKNYMSIPPSNIKVDNYQQIGFTNLQGKNFELSANSQFKGKGANIGEIMNAMPKELFAKISE